jgi:hypothetical protein
VTQLRVAANALQEYRARIDARRAERDVLTASDARLSHARLATFVAGAVIAVVAWWNPAVTWWVLVPAAAFVWLVRRHARVLQARELAIKGIALYERGVARIEDRWVGTGEPGDRFRDDQHVYANDLDLFGRGSLFELLSQARTRTGEAMLAGWLTSPANGPEIQARQAAVEELAPAVDLREQLALAGANIRASVDTDRVVKWAESPMPSARMLGAVVWVSTGATVLAIVHMAVTYVWWPISVLVIAQAALFRWLRDQMDTILSKEPGDVASFVAGALTHRARDLDTFAGLLVHLERPRFESSRLASLRSRLAGDRESASATIRQLPRLTEIYDLPTHAAIVPGSLFLLSAYTSQQWLLALALTLSALLILVRPHVALAVQRWRSRHGRQIRVWVETVAEFEALGSLAGYRYEHEHDSFPEIVPPDAVTAGRAVFEGVQLGHPLLPRATAVANDVRLGEHTQLLVVSGSNMSGKSTLLRTVGVNTVLALAGAPVRAASLRLSPVAIGATIRIQDSLIEGRSRFYAEITRLRTLVDIAAGPVPALLLLDELFSGTNSHDRLVAAEGVLRSLLDQGAIGLITTHDLALTAIADELAPRAINVHFQDWFEDNTIKFDYRMKPGPVTRSNALALMRAVGLDVTPRRQRDQPAPQPAPTT